MTLAVRAGVGAAPVLDDEQRRRLVIELLAALGADLDPWLATLGAAAFGLGQLVEDRDAREILGQCLAAVAALLLLGAGFLFGSRIGGGRGLWRGGRRRVVEGVGDQQRLIGVESFGARAVEAAEEEIEPMLEFLVLVPGPVQDVEQFEDHLLEDDGIVGQRRRGVGEGRGGGGSEVRAHTLLDARTIQMIRCFSRNPRGYCSASGGASGHRAVIAPRAPHAGEIDPRQEHDQVRGADLDLRGPVGRGGEAVAPFLESLDVGITIPSFLWRYTNFARSGCCGHESSAPMAIGRDGSWE